MHARALIFLFLIPIAAFSSTLTGKAVESDGITPVAGATVRFCAGATGGWGYCEHSVYTQTNADGTYELQIPADVAVERPTSRSARINSAAIHSKRYFDLTGRTLNGAIIPAQRLVDGLWIGTKAGRVSQAVYVSSRNKPDNSLNQSVAAVSLAKSSAVAASITVSPIGYYPAVIEPDNTNLCALDNQTIELTRASYYQDARLLDSAYRLDSPDLLREFMDGQSDRIAPITNSAYAALNDTLKAIHDIFKVVYRPDSLVLLLGAKFVGSASAPPPYAVVQSSIRFNTLASEDLLATDLSGAQTYAGFYPVTVFEQTSAIYGTPRYDSILTNYLMFDDAINAKRQDGLKRLEFVRKAVYLGENHVGTAWNFATGPLVEIAFNTSLTKAHAHFFVSHLSGHATLHKVGQEWLFVESIVTGIE